MNPLAEVDVVVFAAGSIWGHLTEHGGGLTGAIVFGWIAGSRCAATAEVAGVVSGSDHA